MLLAAAEKGARNVVRGRRAARTAGSPRRQKQEQIRINDSGSRWSRRSVANKRLVRRKRAT